MNFGEVFSLLKQGISVRRSVWRSNDENFRIRLVGKEHVCFGRETTWGILMILSPKTSRPWVGLSEDLSAEDWETVGTDEAVDATVIPSTYLSVPEDPREEPSRPPAVYVPIPDDPSEDGVVPAVMPWPPQKVCVEDPNEDAVMLEEQDACSDEEPLVEPMSNE